MMFNYIGFGYGANMAGQATVERTLLLLIPDCVMTSHDQYSSTSLLLPVAQDPEARANSSLNASRD